MKNRFYWLLPLMVLGGCASIPTAAPVGIAPVAKVGENVPSEDPAIWDFHALGAINGKPGLFRSAAPLRDLTKAATVDPTSAPARATAAERMQSLAARGIRTIVSFEDASSTEKEDKSAWIALEKSAAAQAGIAYVSCPLANSGTGSLQDESDAAVLTQLQAIDTQIMQRAQNGGVLLHCSAGHDRTGIVVAYLRLKYQHWTADRAIQEMRDMGHNWIKYSSNGGVSSWHEDHVRALAALLAGAAPASK